MSNPILNEKTVFSIREMDHTGPVMTVKNTILNIFALGIVMVLSAIVVVHHFMLGHLELVNKFTMVGSILGLILSFVTAFMPKYSPYTSLVYAFCEGAVLAGISCYFEAIYPGIVLQAVFATFISLFAVLFLYMTKIIKVTKKLVTIITGATLSILLLYLIFFIAEFFFHITTPYSSTSGIGIILSVIVCLIAISNFLVDFKIIEDLSNSNAPEYYNWYCAFSILVTLVWVYVEILRLLAKLNSRR